MLNERFPATSGVIIYYKGSGKGHESMCDAVEELVENREKKSNVKLLLSLIRKGSIPKDESVEESGLSAEEFDKIAADLALANN